MERRGKNIYLAEKHLEGKKIKIIAIQTYSSNCCNKKKNFLDNESKQIKWFLYCAEHDSTDHTFNDCEFAKSFVKNVKDWFNAVNNSNLTPTIEEKLFGIMSRPYDKTLLTKFNYTTFLWDSISTLVGCKTKLFTSPLSLIKCYLNTEYNIFLNN